MKSEIVPLLVISLVVFGMLIIPFKITGYGYLPPDDALRHSAKVISGKEWADILVLGDDIRMNSNPGWHFMLSAIHKTTNCDADSLIVFSVIFLFILFCLIPIPMLDYHEAWPATLLLISVANPSFIMRLLLGRPYIFTMSVVLILGFLWPSFKHKRLPYTAALILVLSTAMSTWVHCNWYLLALPVASFFIARQWRAGARIAIAVILGIILGALLTGHPFLFLKESSSHIFDVFGNNTVSRMLVVELQPFAGDVVLVIAVSGILILRKLRGISNQKIIRNPLFILMSVSWSLAFISQRFWLDWGIPAFAVWAAREFQEVFNSAIDRFAWRRFSLAAAILATFYFAATNDINSRWTANLAKEYLSVDNPKQAAWLPGQGGIIYSDDMTIFYDTFFKNPQAPWRYILGPEATIMPNEDLEIFRRIQWNFGAYESFEPWVKKMRPEDRLIIRRPAETSPEIAGLEWYYAATGIWIGRLPKEA